MKRIEQYIKEEMKDCPFTQEQKDKLLIGLTKFLDDLEKEQLNIHSVVQPKANSSIIKPVCICDEMREKGVDNWFCDACKTEWV